MNPHNENVLKKIIAGDEPSVYGYDHETKRQSSQCKLQSGPRPKKTRQSRSNVKFLDYDGVVHHEYALTGQTINKEWSSE